MLVPASAPTASHDALNGYAPSVGFPTNERGQNINDRDYQSDKAAQAETDRIARVYGGQAVSDTPVVSPEGIVYSGNGRTMASQLAAANGTDSAYMEALRSNAAQFGFTPEQVDSIPNARVVFVTDEVLPYTTETFAKFNQQEKKTQSSTERAVSKSKSLKDTSIARILSIIDSYDTLQSFFSSPKACADMLSVLQQDGVITEAEVAGLTELNSNNETVLSATGRDLVTDVVLGATFSEQTLRQMGGDKALKQSVLRALPSIIENRQLKEYALNNELEKAISLLYEARKAKMSLEQFLQTTDMFNGSPTDRYSAFEVLLAEKFNNSTEAFRVMMQLYNNSASTLVGGQSELFGEALTKEDIQNLILEKYGKQTNNRGDQAEPATQSESGNRQDNETTAAERRAKYGITAKEDARREPLRERAREVAEKLGANINVIEDKSEVTNEDAKKQMRQHKNSIVKGWFENSTGELFIVLPSMDDMADLEATILHELVAHKGLRNLLGARKFNQLCDAVWEMMTPEQQQEWLAYPGVNGNKRAAADEYIASLAEKMDLSEVEQTAWSKIKQFVLDLLQKLGFRDITENDIQDLIRASYAYMRAGNTNEQTTNEGNRYKVYRSRDGKEVGYTQLSQLSLQFDWGERERDTVSGRNTDVLQREDDTTLTTLNTLRGLEEGEVCNVERIFTESKGFDFTSGEKIESAADVAYIFKNLEDEAIENVFVALVKDGKPTVIHVGMGGQAYSLVDNSAVVAAANRINPDKVYLVHNHPSGVLRCSPQDRSMLKSVKDALGDVVQDGIIINTRSGKFGVFSESMFGTDGTSDMPENKEDTPLKVYKFNKQAFKSNVITIEASPNGIAEFISTQRLGSRNKINALLLNSQFGCVGNVFLTETEVNDTNRDSIAQRLVDDAVAMNARNIVIYGNYPLVSVAVESNIQLRDAIEKASGKTVELKDVIEINGSAFPPSALNYGVRFRTTIAPEVRGEMEAIKADAIANGTFLKAPNGKDTNLNEEQWLMVRTGNFKKWFGDWMLAATETPVFRSKGTFANLATAEKWAKENLQGQSRVNKYTGEEISISRKSVSEMLNEKTLKKSDSVNNHLAALQSVFDFIEMGIPAEVHADTHGRDFDVMRLYNAIEIDDKVYRVKSTVRKVKQGDKFYTYEVQEMELIEERGADPNREGETPHNGNTSNNSITGAKLLNGVKKTNSNEEILQYSKVVDENGEPMVVYHGSPYKFTKFNPNRIGYSTGTADGRGFYFTTDKTFAEAYKTAEGELYQVFLNIKNPLDYNKLSITKSQLKSIISDMDKTEVEQKGEHYFILNYEDYTRVGVNKAIQEATNLEYEYAENDVELINSIIGASGDFTLVMDSVEKVTGKGSLISPKANGTTHYIVTSPNQIKSATDNNGEFGENNDIRFRVANENQEIFVSNAQRAVENIKQDKATPEQWLAMIAKQGGLKAGEDKWLGLSDWLKSSDAKIITKQEILDFIAENKIQIEEVHYSQFGYGLIDEAARNIEKEVAAIGWEGVQSKYPGIEEYFELDRGEVLWSTLNASIGEYEDFIIDNKIVDVNPQDNAINETREQYTTEGLNKKREIALTVPTIESWKRSDEVHFGDAGEGRAIAWIRFGETEAPMQDSNYKRLQEIYDRLSELEMKVASSEGITMEEYEERARLREERDSIPESENKRILVIDEIQSKRHQEGREKGYSIGLAKVKEVENKWAEWYSKMSEKYGPWPKKESLTKEEQDEGDKLSKDIDEVHSLYMQNRDGVPDAPFDKNWHEIAMKRMLRLAAEEGYDYVAWTTGAQQAERYDLSKSVDVINAEHNEDGSYNINIATIDDSHFIQESNIPETRLTELVGKEAAVSIVKLRVKTSALVARV